MKRNVSLLIIAIVALLNIQTVKSQNKELSVKLTDPAKAGKLSIELFVGSIKIVAYAGKDVIVSGDGPYLPGKAGQNPVRDSTKKLSDFISQDNNLVRIKVEKFDIMNLVIKVPRNFSLVLKTQAQGNIDVENVNGDQEISVVSGNITLFNIGGSVSVNNTTGTIKVDMNAVNMNAHLVLSSVMGTITLKLPSDQKANVKLQSDFAAIHSDFDIDEGSADQKPKSIIHRTIGKINGGGTEIYVKSVGGDIYLKKKK
ncbi:DUF4097 family beta strand repeat-containing protein [Mucilaginibacter sp.]|jgi:hypothetical protein|uniref:DUF4097 family beta strand repeat-containing protein n=1 Tax=Mucilaginibacter sp. TaxID=1882438 RepID=UPI00356758C4